MLQIREPPIDFGRHNRIAVLAELRNRAFEPLWQSDNQAHHDLVAVVAFNDVYLRAVDVLELLHQHIVAGQVSGKETGITTGMDYYERWPEWYYDVWVGRTVSKESGKDVSRLTDILSPFCSPFITSD